jgi:hypothetical protein
VKIATKNGNVKIGRETIQHPMIGKYSMHETKNENGLVLIGFAAGRQMAIRSTYFMQKRIYLQTWHSPDERTSNQIDHCMIDGRHFSDVFDVKVQRAPILIWNTYWLS